MHSYSVNEMLVFSSIDELMPKRLTLLQGTYNITLSNPLGENQTQMETAAIRNRHLSWECSHMCYSGA